MKTSSLSALEKFFLLVVQVFLLPLGVTFVGSLVHGVVNAAPVESAQFPVKPVRWIVPVPAGGSLDILARIVAQKLAERWGSQIVVDNRPGAGNRLGTEIAANATADGYTQALLASPTLTSAHALHGKTYDPVKAFTPITMVAATSQLLVVNLGLLRNSNGASVINITSIKGKQPPPRVVTSGVAWAAAINFSKGLSMELAPEGIRVNVVSVGGIMTEQMEAGQARWAPLKNLDEFLAPRVQNIPLKRLGTDEEVAQAILFLASPLSSYITGQCIAVDGGGLRTT